jgi:multiple sugar transport system permease protein
MKLLGRSVPLYVMLLPYLAGLFGLVLLPAALSLGLVFVRYDALGPPTWAGLGNLRELAVDRLAHLALANTTLYLVLAVALRLLGALTLALLLHGPAPGARIARPLVVLPTLLPEAAYALLWLVMFNPRYGPINQLLGLAGVAGPAWLGEPGPALAALVIMAGWQMGEGFVLLLASLNDVPRALYEMAAMDGAGVRARFWHVTLPLLLPRLLLLSMRDSVVVLQASLAPAQMLLGGGAGYATLVVPLYSYLLAFDDLRLGYAATLSWAMYLIALGWIGLQVVVLRRSGHRGAFGA